MAEKLLFKIGISAEEKKAIVAQNFAELLEKGSQKLNVWGKITAYMQDGTEIEDDGVLSVVEKKNNVIFTFRRSPVSIAINSSFQLLPWVFSFCHNYVWKMCFLLLLIKAFFYLSKPWL